MITESEIKALQLAKKVFEHFTHDALPIAREIIAMEHELNQSPVNVGLPDGEITPLQDIKITGGNLVAGLLNDFPNSDLNVPDPAQPVKQINKELVYQQQDDFPF